jgi:transcriptional regulator with XRE-family HTH domain
MSRMGQTIQKARLAAGMTEKALGKKCGLAESVVRDIEAGRRVASDDQARRMLKVLGAENPVSAELEVAAEPSAPPRPRPYVLPAQPERDAQAAASAQSDEPGGAWLDALGGVMRRVPVCDEGGLVLDHVLEPVVGGRIEGGAPDKVFYYRCPDNALAGYRVYAGDLLLTVPERAPTDDAIMILERGGRRIVRKIHRQEGGKLLLQTYDREFRSESVGAKDVLILGRCVRLMRQL